MGVEHARRIGTGEVPAGVDEEGARLGFAVAGHVVGDGEAESSAFFIHSRLHLARPDAACVLHTHMPYATALALTETGFETRLSQNSVRFHGRYALMPGYGGLVNDAVEGDRLAEAVADGVRVVLLANHGVLVIGESLARSSLQWTPYGLSRNRPGSPGTARLKWLSMPSWKPCITAARKTMASSTRARSASVITSPFTTGPS